MASEARTAGKQIQLCIAEDASPSPSKKNGLASIHAVATSLHAAPNREIIWHDETPDVWKHPALTTTIAAIGGLDMTSAARQIFDRIQSNADIEALVADQTQEHLNLDFKQITCAEGLDRNARKLFAECLSGYANSSGGVIVWGVATDRDEDGIDCASELKPIENVKKVFGEMQSLTGQAVAPIFHGIDHKWFDLGEGTGFIITVVDETDGPPRMAKLGEDRHYMRVGDSFKVMEHTNLEDMYGRRHRPKLEFFFQFNRNVVSSDDQPKIGHGVFGLKNTGRAIAKHPMLDIYFFDEHDLVRLCRSGNGDYDNEFRLNLASSSRRRAHRFIGGSEKVIYSNEKLVIGRIQDIPEPARYFDIIFEYDIAAEGISHESHRVKFHRHSMQTTFRWGQEQSHLDPLLD